MEFRILGPVEVVDGDGPLELGGEKVRALLALLLLHANEVVSRDRLLDELWGEQQPRSGSTALRVRVAELRKTLGGDRVETRSPGYALRVAPDELDLSLFEQLVQSAVRAEPAEALRLLDEALALWRGPPLADISYERFAQAPIGRLEELRLAAVERRVEVRLELGSDERLTAELRELVAEHPFREQLRGQLMRVLYSSGRQADALAEYRDARRLLADELGIQPGPALQELEQRVLRQDSELTAKGSLVQPTRTVLIVSSSENGLDALVALMEPLAVNESRELMLTRVVDRAELSAAAALLAGRRDDLVGRGVPARAAVFSSARPARDLSRLASDHDADLLVLEGGLTDEARKLLEEAPCDVALLPEQRTVGPPGPGRPILVPFTGADHDWAGVELAAWIARATNAELVLAGSATRTEDASRLLASASLILQRAVGISTSPLLVEPGAKGLLAAAGDSSLVVFGLPEDWRRKGVGEVRHAVAEGASAPTLIVRRGLRPGGLAPAASHTRFTWTIRG